MRAALGLVLLVVAWAGPARADFFDDLRRTFTKDIPRTFEHDIPRAFGAEPRKAPDPGEPVKRGAKPEPAVRP